MAGRDRGKEGKTGIFFLSFSPSIREKYGSNFGFLSTYAYLFVLNVILSGKHYFVSFEND